MRGAHTGVSETVSIGQQLDADERPLLLGVCAIVVGEVISNLGLLLQRYALLESEPHSSATSSSIREVCNVRHDVPRLFSKPLWLVGQMLFLSGKVLSIAASGVVPLSIIAVLGPLQLVCNSVFAPIILKEVLTRNHITANILIVCGALCAVMSRPSNDNSTVASDMVERPLEILGRAPVLLLASAYLLLLACIRLFGDRVVDSVGCAKNPQSPDDDLERPLLLGDACVDTDSPQDSHWFIAMLTRWNFLHTAYHVAFLGSVCGVLGASCGKVLMSSLFHDGDHLTHHRTMNSLKWSAIGPHWKTLAVLGIVGFSFGVCSVALLNVAVYKFGALITVAVYYGFSLLHATFWGLLFFREWDDYFFRGKLLANNLLGLLSGMVLNLTGLGILTALPG